MKHPRKILFFGNCQAELVCGAARAIFANDPDVLVLYRPSFNLSEHMRQEIAELATSAEDVFLQRGVFEEKWIEGLVPAAARVHYFPVMRLTFLWPDMDKNMQELDGNDGPLFGLRSSTVLTRLREEPGGLHQRIDRYVNSDIAAQYNIERLMRMDRIAMQHVASGTDLNLWERFERVFRDRRPYYSSFHPHWTLFEPVVRYVIAVIGGADPGRVEAVMNRFGDRNWFSTVRMPLHPSVARSFDLKWEEHDYDMYNYKFGFADARSYCRLYLRPGDMPAFKVYHAAVAKKQVQVAIMAAKRVLSWNIGAPSCIHIGLAELLAQTGRSEEAGSEGERILALYSFDFSTMIKLVTLAQQLGQLTLSEQALMATSGAAGHANNTLVLRSMMNLAGARGDDAKAIAVARELIGRDPFYKPARARLGLPLDRDNVIEDLHWKGSLARRQTDLAAWRRRARMPAALPPQQG